MVISQCNEIGKFDELKGMNRKQKVVKRGTIVRAGDIIRFGRVPVMIKESSIDLKKWEHIQ